MKRAACDCPEKPPWPTVTRKWAEALRKAKGNHLRKANIARVSAPRASDLKANDVREIGPKASGVKGIAAAEVIAVMIGVAVVAHHAETIEGVVAGAGTDTKSLAI
jgi:hypothetical protein